MSWQPVEQPAATAAPEPSPQPSRPAPAPTLAPAFGGASLTGTYGAVILAAFVLVLISGVLGLVNGIQRLDDRPPGAEMEGAVVLLAGIAALASAFLMWQGKSDVAGIVAIVCGVIFLVLGPETAGLLAVLGGILALMAGRVPQTTA